MYKKKFWIPFFLLLSLCCFITGCSQKNGPQPEYIFRYAEFDGENSPRGMAAMEFARLVQEESGGRIAIEVYLDGELGNERSAAQQVLLGGIDFCSVNMELLQDGIPELEVLSMPFLFPGKASMWNVLDGRIGSDVLDSMTEHGLEGLAFMDGGLMHLCTKDRLGSYDDMKDESFIAVPNTCFDKILGIMGAIPQDIYKKGGGYLLPWESVQGCEVDMVTYYQRNFYEQVPYMYMSGHRNSVQAIIASPYTLRAVSAEDEELLRDCAKRAAVYQRTLYSRKEQEIQEDLREQGVVIVFFPEPERYALKKKLEMVYAGLDEEQSRLLQKIEKEMESLNNL